MKNRGPHPALKGGSSPSHRWQCLSVRTLRCATAWEENPACPSLPKGGNDGFTLVELMVVGAILGLALVVSLPLGAKWLDSYRYSAACRSFYNGVHLAKINAISGSTLFNITEIDGTGGGLKVTTDYYYFRCDHTPKVADGDYRVNEGTFIALAGFNDPDYAYLNGNVFKVIETPTVDAVSDEGGGKYKAKLTLKLRSDLVQWSGGPATSNTGKAWTVAAATFVTTEDRQALEKNKLPVYSVYKSGGTVQCEYDPSLYYIEVNGKDQDPKATPPGENTPIVFDSQGAPKDLVPYTILIRRKKAGGTLSTQDTPFTITVQSSGKILSGG